MKKHPLTLSEAMPVVRVTVLWFFVAATSLFGCSGNPGESNQEPAWLEAQKGVHKVQEIERDPFVQEFVNDFGGRVSAIKPTQ